MSHFIPAVPSTDAPSFPFKPKIEKLRCFPLVATWAALTAASWAVVCGLAKLAF